MKVRLFFNLILLILLFSCSKNEQYKVVKNNGITTIINTGKTVSKNFYSLRKVGVIDSVNFSFITDLKEDKAGNIYIADMRQSKIFKFSPNLKLISSFGRRGEGPGEFAMLQTLTIKDDTIYIPDGMTLKILKYNLKGDFLSFSAAKDVKTFTPSFITFKNIFIGGHRNYYNNEKKQGMLKNSITTFDHKFNYLKNSDYSVTVRTYMEDESIPINPEDEIFSYCVDSNFIYVANASEKDYEIFALDSNLNIKKKIKKLYALKKLPQSYRNKIKEDGEKIKFKFYAENYKAVYSLMTDRFNRLWVKTANNGNQVVNIFQYDIYENGIYKGCIHLNNSEQANIIYIGKRLYLYNEDKNTIEVYEYS